MRSVSRTKNSKRNIASGLIRQATNILLTFIIRTAVFYSLGAEYQGLDGLFSSIVHVLNLADLGFATAVMYILYKPIAEEDHKTICAVMQFLKRIYFVVGLVITVAGCIAMFFLPKLISGTVPNGINIYILFAFYLLNTAVSYLLFAYKSTLLSALQRQDVISNIYTFTTIAVKMLQLITLFVFRNYYVYVLILPLGTILNNIIVQYFSKKLFPKIIPHGDISNELKSELTKQVKAIFIGKMSDIARNSFDNIILSSFFGLVTVAIYGNYFYIYSAIYGVMNIIINGVIASVGNSIATESPEKNYRDMLTFNTVFMIVVGFCTVCLLNLYQPFMLIWMKGNSSMLMSNFNMGLMCLYFYAINMTYVRSMYLDGKGLFFESRWWCIVESIANLLLNIVLGKLLGITGVIIATIITIFIFNFLGRNSVLFKFYFKKSKKEFYGHHLLYFAMTCIICIITFSICQFVDLNGVWGLIIRLAICSVISPVLYFLFLFKTKQFTEVKRLVLSILNKR